MIVSLYTAKVTLNVLGIIDYGVYNVVAGIIGFLAVLNGAMVSASQRFLSYEIGQGDSEGFNKIFSTLLIIFTCIAILFFTIGLGFRSWIIYDFLVIPDERKIAASYIFLFSLIAFGINMTSIPYMSSIVAHERMGVYGYVGILEALLKLLVVYFLVTIKVDKLILYGLLNLGVTILITLVYRFYCIKSFSGCNIKLFFEKPIFIKLLSYIGWNLFGSFTGILNVQGQSILLNVFFGPIVNGAKAIADRIYSIVSSFSSNINLATRPQIVKSYAKGDYKETFNLVFISTKFSFYLILILTMPLITNMEFLLSVWLGIGNINSDVVIFSQLILIYSLVNIFEQPISAMIQATGNIKKYQVCVGMVTLAFLPLVYFLFKCDFEAYYSLIALILIYTIALVVRLLIAKNQVGFPVKDYLLNCIVPILIVSVFCIAMYYLVVFDINLNIYISIFSSVLIKEILLVFFIYFLGINDVEKQWVKSFFKKKF